jgi:prepilin-type N-terminal cleavage/methylation domain-containing protein
MRPIESRDERGFSLIELLIVMVVTVIVTGAMYGLLASGQSAFRREPELSDRQQNIRTAVAMIESDVLGAGAYMPTFAQVFTDGLNAAGPALGTSGVDTDQLRFLTSGNCDVLPVCPGNQGSPGVNVFTQTTLTGCFTFPSFVLLANGAGNWGVYWAEKPGSGTTNACNGDAENGHVNLPPGQAPDFNPPGGPNFNPDILTVVQGAHYKVEVDGEGIPNLWRSWAGGLDDPDGNSTWQMVARGVEDLQVRYELGGGWVDDPGVPVTGDLNTLVRRVEVTLWSRAITPNLQGATENAAVGGAVRGKLVNTITVRSAFTALEINRWTN